MRRAPSACDRAGAAVGVVRRRARHRPGRGRRPGARSGCAGPRRLVGGAGHLRGRRPRATGSPASNPRRAPHRPPRRLDADPGAGTGTSDLDRDGYLRRLAAIKRAIEAGDVYQVNLCRRLTAPLPAGADPAALAALLAAGNPAPVAGRALRRRRMAGHRLARAVPRPRRRPGRVRTDQGHRRDGDPFADKDFAENIMITDLVRNDLNRVCRPESVPCPRCWPDRAAPGAVAPGLHGARPAAARTWLGATSWPRRFRPGRSAARRSSRAAS